MSIRINVGATFDAKDLQRAQRELDALARQANTLSTRMNALGTSFQSAGKQISAVGSTMTRRLTLPIVGAGVAAVKTAMDFETSFAQIEGLVGVTGDELDVLRQAAVELGPAFGKSAGEAGEALFFITSAGLRGQEAIDVLEASLKASAAGLGDVATIADLATSVMNAYGSDTVSAAQATDILTAAVREGKLEPAELAGSMGSVLPIASAMGISFEEVGATFAAMSRTGTGASEAATQLRGIMTSLLKPTVQAEEALGEMGLSSAGLREQIKDEGLLSVLETLTEAFAENETGAEQVFGNVRALSGVMDLMGSNVEGTRQIFENMATTTGMLDGAFDAVSGTGAFQFSQTMAELKAVLLELGTIIAPFAQQLVESFRGVLEMFQNLSPEQQQQVVRFLAIAAAVGPLLIIMGKLIAAVGSIIKGAVLLGKGIALLASPFGLIVLGIAALIAIGVLLYKNWDTVKERGLAAWNGLKDGFVGAWDAMKGTARTAGNFIIGFLNGVIGAYEAAINAVGNALNSLPFVGRTMRIPDWVPLVGGNSFSIPSVPRVNFPKIPMLAEGGIVRSATLAMIGEAGPEAVIPLDRAGGMGGTSIVVNVSGAVDPEGTARQIRRILQDAERRSGVRVLS
jgi:TP901 family phage tail tape measure protein